MTYGAARDHFGEAPGERARALLQCHALRADLKAVAVAAQAIFDKDGFPLPHSFNVDNMEYLALRQALARDGVKAVLEEVKDG